MRQDYLRLESQNQAKSSVSLEICTPRGRTLHWNLLSLAWIASVQTHIHLLGTFWSGAWVFSCGRWMIGLIHRRWHYEINSLELFLPDQVFFEQAFLLVQSWYILKCSDSRSNELLLACFSYYWNWIWLLECPILRLSNFSHTSNVWNAIELPQIDHDESWHAFAFILSLRL